jgi:hypothetical protein
MTPRRSRAAAALPVVAVLVLAAGCGGKDGGDSKFAKQSGAKIAAAAKADMKDLDEMRFKGELTSDGSKITLDIQASSAGDCTGTIGIGDGTAEVAAKDGVSWFKPDEAFWRASAPDQADAILAAVGDKWVLDTDANFSQFCDLDSFLDGILKDDSDGKYQTKGTSKVDGKDVVAVEQTDEKGTSTGYVLVDGKHYLVKIERTEGDEPGEVAFSDFNEEFDVDAPSDDEVIDLSSLS